MSEPYRPIPNPDDPDDPWNAALREDMGAVAASSTSLIRDTFRSAVKRELEELAPITMSEATLLRVEPGDIVFLRLPSRTPQSCAELVKKFLSPLIESRGGSLVTCLEGIEITLVRPPK